MGRGRTPKADAVTLYNLRLLAGFQISQNLTHFIRLPAGQGLFQFILAHRVFLLVD